jgi:hypothetical protein
LRMLEWGWARLCRATRRDRRVRGRRTPRALLSARGAGRASETNTRVGALKIADVPVSVTFVCACLCDAFRGCVRIKYNTLLAEAFFCVALLAHIPWRACERGRRQRACFGASAALRTPRGLN